MFAASTVPCLSRVQMLLHYRVRPLLVFDGGALPAVLGDGGPTPRETRAPRGGRRTSSSARTRTRRRARPSALRST